MSLENKSSTAIDNQIHSSSSSGGREKRHFTTTSEGKSPFFNAQRYTNAISGAQVKLLNTMNWRSLLSLSHLSFYVFCACIFRKATPRQSHDDDQHCCKTIQKWPKTSAYSQASFLIIYPIPR